MKIRVVSSRGVLGSISLIYAAFVFLYGQVAVRKPADPPAFGYRLSGPYTHENLTIYLIHGKDRLRHNNLLTLSEALKQKKVTVHETGNVNQLLVENASNDDVFIHAGDIVKGGKQDRTFPEDCLLPARSGKTPVAAFCVEQGRWQQRHGEAVAQFASADAQLSSKELKLAAKHERLQGSVWKAIESEQVKLSRSLAVNVPAAASPTSFQLSLENKTLKKETKLYLEKLQPAGQMSGVVGYAFAINGEVNSADVYSSHALFRKLWPALLESSAVEAISKRGKVQRNIPRPEEVKNIFADAEAGKVSRRQTSGGTAVITKESGKSLLFETRDRKERDAWIHRSYVTK